MSRVLKFRAWDSATGKVSEPFDVKESWGDYLIDFDDYSTDGALDSIIWEQFTGLTDKNGQEIYEGDIVKCYSRRKLIGEYQVIWNEDCGGFECESLKPLIDGGDRMLKDVRVFNEISIQFRVIGNVHEDKEWLDDSN